ncbi:MAG: acetyl-CoA synthase subunit gamma [Deltaproteobacteria bacterium]|nr:acetyl-CoA synthase subunit gamma [Deltaproteobacteria bacterium]
MAQDTACACGQGSGQDNKVEHLRPSLDQPFVSSELQTPIGPVPVVLPELTRADRLGSIKTRLGIGRMRYVVEPGLYALRNPDNHSPVLVSANYKLSFDHLRSALPGRSAWVLVLDTKGINVWCAAGKRTFGTQELTDRVASSRLAEVVEHRTLIVPQLGAPGVAAHLVRRQSSFRVIFGPIKAVDLPAFLDAGNKATVAMRRKLFTVKERAVLIGVELGAVLKYGILIGLALFFLAGLGYPGELWDNTVFHGSLALTGLITAILAGAVATPLLLPWLPGRAFALKGFFAGLALGALHGTFWWSANATLSGNLELGGWMLLGPAFAAFLAMNFTGSSTYTSLSGVKKEMRFAVPLEIVVGLGGLALIVTARFVA